METEKAIKYFEDEIRFCERAPAGNIAHTNADWTRILAASKAALEALKEKRERENPKPLTVEELRGMIGEPVWVQVKSTESGYWSIVSRTLLGLADGFTAYRSKPDHFREVTKMMEVQR